MSTGITAGYWDVGLAEYHADRECVSSTALEIFRESREEYHAIYVAETRKPKPPTWEMRLGTALHAYVLENARFGEQVAIEPAWGRKKDDLEAKAAFREANAGKTIIDQEDVGLVIEMSKALRASPVAGPLLFDADGVNEQAIRWDTLDIWCKCCFDRLLSCGIDLNLKTCSNPRPDDWARHAHGMGYHRQAALYRMGKNALLSKEPTYHVVISSQWPHRVGVYRFGDREMSLGMEEVFDALDDLATCRSSGEWKERWQTEITEITFPRYAFRS